MDTTATKNSMYIGGIGCSLVSNDKLFRKCDNLTVTVIIGLLIPGLEEDSLTNIVYEIMSVSQGQLRGSLPDASWLMGIVDITHQGASRRIYCMYDHISCMKLRPLVMLA